MIRDPVIVLGPPRSGTTMLFATLARSSHLWSLGGESHAILEGPYHPSLRGWHSNVLTEADLDAATAEALRREFERQAQPGSLRRAEQDRRDGGTETSRGAARLGYRLVRLRARMQRCLQPVRLLEKTPKNCLRVPFVRALFPDAKFVVLWRDARATISSLMDGWRVGGTYETYRLPEALATPDRPGGAWCFVLPQGWRALVRAPLEEVCAAQWLACVDALQAALPRLREEGRVFELRYERLVERPREALEPLLRFLGIPFEPAMLSAAGGLRLVSAVTPPEPGKWARRNGEAITRIWPRIGAAQRQLGYEP